MKKIILFLILFSAPAWAAEVYTNQTTVTVAITATDQESGMGEGALMRFSNDGDTWSPPEPFNDIKSWNLTGYGGNEEDWPRTVYAKISDVAGNWSEVATCTVSVDTTPPTLTIRIKTDNPAGD